MASHPEVEQSLRHLRDITAQVRAELSALPAAAWDAPSNCPPWPVRRLAAHLIENAQFIRENVQRGVEGSVEPGVSQDERRQRVEAIAASSPAEMVAKLDQLTNELETLLDRLTPEELESICYHPAGNRSARWYAQQRLAEVAFHHWDLRRSVGQEAHIGDEIARFLLPMLVESNLPRIYARGKEKGTGRFVLAASDAPDQRWLLVASPEALTVQRGGDGAEVTIAAPAAVLARLIYGRGNLAEERAAGRARVEGDPAAAERLMAMLPGA